MYTDEATGIADRNYCGFSKEMWSNARHQRGPDSGDPLDGVVMGI